MNLPSERVARGIASRLLRWVCEAEIENPDADPAEPDDVNRRDRGAELAYVAYFIDGLCRGGTYSGRHWTPEQQARWLLERVESGAEWSTTGDLADMFRRQFPASKTTLLHPLEWL